MTPEEKKGTNMTPEEKKQAVLSVHKYPVTIYVDKHGASKFSTTLHVSDKKWRTVARQNEDDVYSILYDFYFKKEIKSSEFADLKNVCSAFGFKLEHALFLLTRSQGNVSEYWKCGKDHENVALSFDGLLYLIAQGCQTTGSGELTEMHKMLAQFNLQVNSNSDAEEIKRIKAENSQMRDSMNAIMAIAGIYKDDNASGDKKETVKTTAAPKKKSNSRYNINNNDPLLPELTADELKWNNHVRIEISAKAKEYGTTFSNILKQIYHIMTKNYGIVWQQARHDTLETCEMEQETKISTLRVITYDPKLRSIFDGILGNIGNYVNTKK